MKPLQCFACTLFLAFLNLWVEVLGGWPGQGTPVCIAGSLSHVVLHTSVLKQH